MNKLEVTISRSICEIIDFCMDILPKKVLVVLIRAIGWSEKKKILIL